MQEKNIERAQSKPVESTLEKGTFFDPDLKISQIDNSAQSMDVENLAQGGSEGAIVSAREQLAKIIDLPALKAVELLYDKNVQTHSSSANHLDCGGFATINICHDSLSDENKAISDGMIADGLIACSTPDDPTYRGGSKAIIIGVPVNLESSVGQISDLLENLASHFKPQDVLCGRKKMFKNGWLETQDHMEWMSTNLAILFKSKYMHYHRIHIMTPKIMRFLPAKNYTKSTSNT